MDRQELAGRLSDLGGRIWRAIQADDEVTELVFELADKKLALDKVSREESELEADAAERIMTFDDDPETFEQQIPPREWAKYALFNFALDWVLDQALMHMKLEQRWSFREKDGLSKPWDCG